MNVLEKVYLYTKDKTMICKNDIIKFLIYDFDDFTDWELKYLVLDYNTFIYLGDGIDFGLAVGKVEDRDTVIGEMECQEPKYKGFEIVNHLGL